MKIPQLPPFIKGPRFYIPAAIVVVILYFVFFSGSSSKNTTLTVTSGDFAEQVAVSGTVIAAKDADLGFATAGRLSGVYAGVGNHVGAGQLLAQVENGDLAANLAEKRASLASLQAGTRPEQVAIAQAAVAGAQITLMAAIQSAYTAADDAVHNKTDSLFTNQRFDPKLSFNLANAVLKSSTERDRTTIEAVLTSWSTSLNSLTSSNAQSSASDSVAKLLQVNAFLAELNSALNQATADQSASASTLATYASNISTARTSLNTAANNLASAMSALNDAQKTLALDQAGSTASDIAAAQAAVDSASAALAKTEVRAPFSGVITRMDAKVGEIVSPSDSQISIQSDGIFQIEVYVPEVAISGVAVGNLASTTLDAYGTSSIFPAKVISADPAETLKDGVPTYKTILSFLAADPRIRSGMTANVSIVTGMLHNAIVIPAGAVGIKDGGSYVSVLVGKKLEARAVTTGATPALGQVEITSGLSAGDVIELTPAP